MNLIALGLDLGTSGVRVVAVDSHGAIAAQAVRSYPLLTPRSGWTEQHPADWVEASLAALAEVASGLQASTIVGLGLSGQMHGMVALDSSGVVIRPAILWNDQRTGEAVAAIEEAVPRRELIQRTGNPAITGFQLPKLVWLRTEEPQAFAQTQRVLLPKDYLGYVLTGEMATEPSDASGIGCLNLATKRWDTDILSAIDLDPALFPAVIGSTDIVGKLTPDTASHTGLPSGLPVIAGGGDNAAAAIGLGISSADLSKGSLSIGTSGVIFAPLDRPTPDRDGRVHLFCHVDGGYHLLGVTLAAAGSLRWYRETLAAELSYDDLMTLAESSPAGANGVLFLPHLSGERSPYLDPDARGAWIGLSLVHSRSDLTRAVLEGVAFSLRAAMEVIQSLSPVQQLITTGGGTRSPLWRQILADILEANLLHPQAEEGAAYGAALLALVGAGVHPTLEAILKLLPNADELITPLHQAVYQRWFERYQAAYQALKTCR